MTRFEGEEVHNKDNGIKVGHDGQFTIIQTHLPNMYQQRLELEHQFRSSPELLSSSVA